MTSEEVKVKDEIKLDENKEEENQNSTEKEKAKENLDFKELYYSHPSQKDKVKKDFTEYSQVDMTLLNKKRERLTEGEEENESKKKVNEDINVISNEEIKKEEKIEDKIEENNNNKKEEEIKENDLENNLPKELLELIEERKSKEPFTLEDFEKYKAYKKLNVNFTK